MKANFKVKLERLRNVTLREIVAITHEEPPTDSVYSTQTALIFEDGTRLSSVFWRLIKDGRYLVSIFDHNQKYGLPAPINAIKALKDELQNKTVLIASLNEETGDLSFELSGNLKLQVFNFAGYEIWQLTFPDGTIEYSNFALGK